MTVYLNSTEKQSIHPVGAQSESRFLAVAPSCLLSVMHNQPHRWWGGILLCRLRHPFSFRFKENRALEKNSAHTKPDSHKTVKIFYRSKRRVPNHILLDWTLIILRTRAWGVCGNCSALRTNIDCGKRWTPYWWRNDVSVLANISIRQLAK